MLGIKKQDRMERVTEALSDAIAFTDEVVRDRRLRSDLRAAIDHGQRVGMRVRDGVAEEALASRLASDKKLRKNLRALVDDLESARSRVRRKQTHRVRNALLVLAGTSAAVALVPSARQWVTERFSGGDDFGEADVAIV